MMDYAACACSAVRARISVEPRPSVDIARRVGNMPHQTSPTGRILVGTDGSHASVAAVRWAAREAQLRGLRVHVVYVRDRRLPMPHYAPQPRTADAALGAAAGEFTLKAVVQEALGSRPVPDQRDGAQTGAVPTGTVPTGTVPTGTVQMDAVQMELAEGAPARVLLERSVGAEMLVLGSTRPGPGPGGRAGAASAAAPAVQSRPPLGPVARDCLHAAACPVVVVRPSEARAAAEPVHA
jgi:nucleotide-binding universal stress UspA family protein